MKIQLTKSKYENFHIGKVIPTIGFRKYVLNFGKGPWILVFHFFLWEITIWKWNRK